MKFNNNILSRVKLIAICSLIAIVACVILYYIMSLRCNNNGKDAGIIKNNKSEKAAKSRTRAVTPASTNEFNRQRAADNDPPQKQITENMNNPKKEQNDFEDEPVDNVVSW